VLERLYGRSRARAKIPFRIRDTGEVECRQPLLEVADRLALTPAGERERSGSGTSSYR
jgi:hypothetical protein